MLLAAMFGANAACTQARPWKRVVSGGFL